MTTTAVRVCCGLGWATAFAFILVTRSVATESTLADPAAPSASPRALGPAAGTAGYAQAVRQDNPVAWWRFQDPAGADGAEAKDETGTHSGTFRGGVTLEVGPPGIGGKAAKFDGRTAYVDVPNHQDFALHNLSVECWFRSTQVWTEPNWPASATLISKGTEGAGSSDWVLLGGAAEGRQGCVIARPGPKGGPDVVVASPDGLNDDQWHHLVWTRSTAGVNRLFVDGAKVAEIRDSGAAITNDRPIQLGGDPWLGGKSFAGTLADVAVYDKALDEARVAAHFAAVPLPPRKARLALPEARPSLPVTMPARPDGFTPLFDGKSLDGWEGDLKVFRVEDGAIVGGSLKESVRDSVYLATTREFADFELHVKFKTVPTKGDEANGGIQFRSRRLPQGTQVSGYQADLGVFKNFPPGIFWGCLFDNARRDRILAGDPRANEPIVRKVDWNQYVIRTEGRHIRLWLNGQQTVDYTEQDEKIPQSGIIALQAHSGPPQELWYKDIVIKDLARRADGAATPTPTAAETSAGWVKHEKNPVLGGALGTCFDISLLRMGDTYRMYFSWRPKKSIALVESRDGVTWSEPQIVLGPEKATGWEDDLNRPVVVPRDDGYHLWYTGQAKGKSWIGYATSTDGKLWKRLSNKPVLSADSPWEKVAVMCPHVIWDAEAKLFKMWYSGGEQYEPDAIGYATSPDGLTWTKHTANPVFAADPKSPWEQHKVTACQVVRCGEWYLMFYIGFFDLHRAQIGIARSRDGIGGWERHPANPVISPGLNQWDHDACYKPYAIFDGKQWLLWYNGRRGSVEQIGLATHAGEDLGFAAAAPRAAAAVLKADDFQHYIDAFNASDHELYSQHVPNAAAWDFLKDNVPLLDCPDKELERTYYFRWWTYRKHIQQTPDGFVITEFLPQVGWAGKHNTINCAAGHHLREGRWLRDPQYLDDYATFWLRQGGAVRSYSFWIADSLVQRAAVTGDTRLAVDLLPELIANYQGWEQDRLDASGLFWQVDDRDGMEVSLSGALHPQHQGCRATINSYQYGDALAIAHLADLAGQADVARVYRDKAAKLKQLVLEKLWDADAQFFKVLPRGTEVLSDARELHGFTPWYFNLPDAEQSVAWKQLVDPQGFAAPFGPTTAEQRHPKFALSYQGHECQWNGPSWPFATSITLTALANLLNDYPQDAVTRQHYFDLLRIYATSHRLKCDDGSWVPWIDENLNPLTGDWISRTRLKSWKNGTWDAGKGGEERGKDYNHSTFCDLVITGLIGLRPRADQTVEVNPLVPEGRWDWFCLDHVAYHGRMLTILYDRTGAKYGRGQGLRVFADGKEIAASEKLGRVTGELTQVQP